MDEETGELSLKELQLFVLKDIKIVLALALAGLAIGLVVGIVNIAQNYISRTYNVQMEVAIVAQNDAGTYGYGRSEPGTDDVTAARNSITTAARVVQGDQVLNAAVKHLGLIGVTAADLAPNIKAEPLKDSQILTVKLNWKDPDEGIEIMNAIAAVTPDVLIETLKLGNVSVVDSPKIVESGSGLKTAGILVLGGLFVGLLIGVVIAVVRNVMSPTVLDPSSIRPVFDRHLLGAIPLDDSFSGLQFRESIATSAHLLVHDLQLSSGSSEGEEKKRARIAYVTSSVEQEGKSTYVSQLAIELAREGWNTLVVDCDLRNPSLAPLLLGEGERARNLLPGQSLNAVVNRGVDCADAIISINDKLSILPAAIENQPMDLNNRLVELCESLAENYGYDIVLIDTPPVGQVSDAMALNRIADKALFVVRYDYATYQTIQRSLDVLDQADADVLGIVVNCVDQRRFDVSRRYAKNSGRYSFSSEKRSAKHSGGKHSAKNVSRKKKFMRK